jgi:rod shape determining protein RodA
MQLNRYSSKKRFDANKKRLSWLRPWERFDWFLLLALMALMAFGGLVIHSVEKHQGTTHYSFQHWAVSTIGAVTIFALARFRYSWLMQLRWPIYIITNLLLISVLFIGTEVKGAQSWITIGNLNLQPSELAKVGVIITLAATLNRESTPKISTILRVFAITALPWGLTLKEDLGTSLVFGAIVLGMLYWANIPLSWLVLLVSPIVAAVLFSLHFPTWIGWTVLMGGLAWFSFPWRFLAAILAVGFNTAAGEAGKIVWELLQPYQKARLTMFLDPEQDPLGNGYNLIQSRTAVGAGDLLGRGLFQGTQTRLNFVPEQHTDFIFSAVGEQFGFIGSIGLLLVFWFVCLRLLVIACNSSDNFGSLLAIGVLSTIVFQVVLNVSMNIGLAPITGIPLPLISYGGSSLLSMCLAFGIVESVANYRPKKRRFFQS